MVRDSYSGLWEIVAAVILGIITGVVSFTVTIPGIVIAIWIAFGIGIGALVLLTFLAVFVRGREEKCICFNGKCIAIAAVGTIITTIIGLSIEIIVGFISISILIGLGVFFLAFTIFNFLALILCLINSTCKCHE